MPSPRATTRVVALFLGLALVLAGITLIAASFAYEPAYLRNHPLAVAWARALGPADQPLIYPGYEADVEESAIRLMNLGIWTAFGGLATVILSRARRRPPTPPAQP